MDSSNLTNSDFVTITVNPNTAPVVRIIAPSANAEFKSGAAVVFQGTAMDVEDGDITASLTWYSNLMGANPIGAGGTFTVTNLAVGTHTITASATNSGGLTGSAILNITITPDFCSSLTFISAADLVENKGILTWDITNQSTVGSFDFTLIGVDLPWNLAPAGQRLNSITWGGNDLQTSLPDTIPPAVFGLGDWLNMGPNFAFPGPLSGGTLTKQLKYTFEKNLNGTITSGMRTSVTFRLDLIPTIECTLTYMFP